MALNAEQFGRIIYVEPTNIIGDKAVENEDLINHPYEDYCIAVDLTVKIANRYSCGSAAKNGLMETLSWSTDKGNISFMRGTGPDGDLTISYTDVRPSNPVDQDTRECLGIKAIHIQYNSWMYPEVTIEFVDVMGASVLAKEEYDSNRAKDDVVSPNRSLYHALFSFPYPMFILKVKGFYGQGVTYKLAIKKTKMDFDANTGNFNITAEFIGYMYGLYTDMPMTLISVAPYTEFGKKYWETQVANGAFKYHEKDGTEGCGMMTFPEFRYKVAAVAASEEYNSIAKGMDSTMANIQSQKDELNDIKKLMPLSKTLINDAKCIKSSSGRYIRISSKNDVLTEKEFEEKLKAFNEAVNQYTENHGSQDNIINIKSNGKTELKEKDGSIKRQTKVENVVCTKTTTTQNGKSVTDWEILGENVTDEEAAEIKKLLIDNGNTSPSNVSLISLGKNDSEYLDVEGKINSVLETLDNRMNSLKSEAEERQNALIEKALGFRPSIKNIFDMAFAHMETFIQGMGEVLGKIEKGDNQRRKVIKGDDTDVNEETLAPPFFKMFKEKVDSQGNKTNDEVYFDRFDKFNGQELEEDVYVKSLLEGAQLYCERMVDVESTISALSNQSGATKIVASDAPTLSCKNFIPITVYDMVNKDKMANPYKHIKKLCEKNQDIRLATFAAAALRGYYYLCTNPNVKNRWFKDDDIKLIGKVEAINFYKGVGKKINSKFMDFLNTYADGWWDSSEANSIISDLCTTSSDGYKSLWNPNTVDFGDSLFKRTADDNIVLNMQAGENSYLPIGVTDFNEIVTDYASHNLKNFESYIPTKNYQISQKDFEDGNLGVLDEKTTFHMYEDRDYIKNLYNTIEMELQGAVGTGNKAILDGKVDDVMKVYRGYVRETLSGCTLFSNKDTNIFNSGEGGFINKLEQKGESINWENEEESKCDIEEIDGDDLKDLIANGTLQDWNSVYVKYPGIYNEDFDKPIFFHDVYTSQSSLEAKAYIFIFSTPIIIDKDDKDWGQNADGGNGGIPNRVQNGATFKLRLLREGAAYWRENQYKANNSDPINFGNLTNTPKIREVPIAKYGTQKWTEFQTIKLAQNQSYDRWEEPRGTTPSRKSTLIKYFKSWVNSEFTTINNLATKEELYGNETTTNNGNGKSSRGLNGVYVYTTRRTDLTIQYAKQLQEALRKTFLSPCITLDYYTGILTNRDGFNGCSYKELKEFLKGFMKGLQDLYGTLVNKYKDDKAGVVSEITAEEANDPYKSYDIKLSLYQTLCNLYNKWLCSPEERGLDAWKLSNTGEDNGSDFANFIYIDTFYNDKGYDILVNATKVSEWISNCLPSTNLSTNEGLMNYMGRTIYQFLQDVTQSTGGILLALPQKLGVKDNESIVKMFNTYNYNADGWNDDKTTFVYFYSYKPSEHLGDNKNGSINGYPSDGFDINRPEEIIGSLAEPRSDGRSIPAFGVTFGKQNQSLFKTVTLNTDTRSVTEASIAATFNIASQAADGPRESNLYGQDLYRVYSQYAYNADVEMMGNAQIMPLMYFELNNIPLWKGAYVIQKVTHDIVPGNMTTKFTGVRINRNTIPITDGTKINCIKEIEDEESDTGLTGTKATSTNFNPTVNENGQEVTNVTDTKGNIIAQVVTPDSNTAANPKITITDTIDFNEANVTKNKPIICVTPAHGPRTQKRQEWTWSTKMVDNYLIPMLKQCKYSDGTPFNVQRCNKNGNHTSDTGYSTIETQNLIKKYGSECVVSVAPHWNGGAGQYHGVFVNKVSQGVRSDAKKFAECMLASVKVTAGKCDSYSSLPEGAMGGIKSTKIYNLGKDNTDGAVNLNCACILTENWFADFPEKCKWSNDKLYFNKADGKHFDTMRGWLMSDEGCRAIAEMHVRGIQNYINTLKG